MCIIDLIIKIDKELYIKEVRSFGEGKDLFDEYTCSSWLGQKVDYVLRASVEPKGGIVEIKSNFFTYQWVSEEYGASLYLSRQGMLLELYEETIKHVAEGVQIYNKNGYFLHANPASEALEYFKKDDFKGKHLMDIYDLKEDYSTVLTVLRTQKPVVNRCDRFKIRTGKDLTTINSAYPLKINGELYGAVVFESDLSVLKQIKNRTLDLETYVESDKHRDSEKLYNFDNIVHSSKNMDEMIHFAKKVSLTDSSILIVGATGTGKELVAQSIHSFSPRRNKPFIDVNCSAVPSNLFESMFFGTEKGAFTGSIAKQGFFEMANGGTLFLDEVNSINPEMQAKLLRVLQEKRFQRIGGTQYIRCNVRIIAAINEDPFKLIEEEKMRKDFYYRISTIKINVPTLQERKEDIIILVKYFLKSLCSDYSRRELSFTEKFMDALIQYEWPGNIRELQNVIEYAFNKASENIQALDFEHLPDYLQFTETITHKIANQYNNLEVEPKNTGTLEEQMEKIERKILIDTLNLYDRNITQSAKILGMSRQSLQYRIKKLKIFNE